LEVVEANAQARPFLPPSDERIGEAGLLRPPPPHTSSQPAPRPTPIRCCRPWMEHFI